MPLLISGRGLGRGHVVARDPALVGRGLATAASVRGRGHDIDRGDRVPGTAIAPGKFRFIYRPLKI